MLSAPSAGSAASAILQTGVDIEFGEPQRRREILQKSAMGRRLLEVSALSPLEFVQQEFENPTIQAGLLFFNAEHFTPGKPDSEYARRENRTGCRSASEQWH